MDDDKIEIRAICSNDNPKKIYIEWRISNTLPHIKEEIRGIWPFRRILRYIPINPWRNIEIINEQGFLTELSIGNEFIPLSEVKNSNPYLNPLKPAMEKFIRYRSMLKTVKDINDLVKSINESNKAKWCVDHDVEEFIEIKTDSEFNHYDIWK